MTFQSNETVDFVDSLSCIPRRGMQLFESLATVSPDGAGRNTPPGSRGGTARAAVPERQERARRRGTGQSGSRGSPAPPGPAQRRRAGRSRIPLRARPGTPGTVSGTPARPGPFRCRPSSPPGRGSPPRRRRGKSCGRRRRHGRRD